VPRFLGAQRSFVDHDATRSPVHFLVRLSFLLNELVRNGDDSDDEGAASYLPTDHTGFSANPVYEPKTSRCRKCSQCKNGGETVMVKTQFGGGVWLHVECRDEWKAAYDERMSGFDE